MSDDAYLSRTRDLLRTTLAVAVPLWIHEIRQLRWDWDRMHEEARKAAQVVAEKGDIIMFRDNKGETAAAFNELAKGIAILSFQSGGVDVFGLHFETKYEAEDT